MLKNWSKNTIKRTVPFDGVFDIILIIKGINC